MKLMKTKTSVYRNLSVVLLMQVCVFITAFSAPPEEFVNKINKEFEINSDALLRLNSKYGKINCKNWDKNVIAIEVTIEVEAVSQEKADKIFNYIKIDFNGTKSLVEAKTVFNDKVFNLISKKKNKLNVIFDIYYPETISIEVLHKYGNVIIDDVAGKAVLDVSYGTIQIDELGANNNDLEINYGKSSIDEFCGGDINIKYSTLSMDECKDANINSKYSTISIDEASFLMLDSGYDHVDIDEIKGLSAKSQFSEFEIDELKERLEIDIAYGNLDVDEVSSGFDEIIIKNSYSNVKIGVNEEASYHLDAEIKYGSLKFSENHEYITKQVVSSNSSKYEGRVGKDKNTTSKITITCKHAKVSIGD